jgi:hypothetical protein
MANAAPVSNSLPSANFSVAFGLQRHSWGARTVRPVAPMRSIVCDYGRVEFRGRILGNQQGRLTARLCVAALRG